VPTSLIKTKHNSLFQNLISLLMQDLGRTITVYNRATGIDCTYCKRDFKTGRSSGIPEIGKVWSTHTNYDGVGLTCPECSGKGILNTTTTTSVTNVIIEDISGLQIEHGKYAFFKIGTKKLTGKLSLILKTSTDENSEDIIQYADKIVIDGDDYRLVNMNRTGIKDRYLFEAIVERINLIEN